MRYSIQQLGMLCLHRSQVKLITKGTLQRGGGLLVMFALQVLQQCQDKLGRMQVKIFQADPGPHDCKERCGYQKTQETQVHSTKTKKAKRSLLETHWENL